MWRLIDKALPHLLVAFGVMALCVPAAADNTVVKRFQSGLGLDAVGLVDASEDTEVAGPQAIYVGENGHVYLLDQVNSRVLQFDPKDGGQTRSYRLPSNIEPTDLIVTRDHIMVWDGNVHALRPSGPDNASVRGLDEDSTRAVDDEFTVSAFAQMGSQRPSGDTDLFQEGTRSLQQSARVRQAVATRGEGPVIVDVVASKSPALFYMEVRRKDETNLLARLKIQVRDRLGAAEFLEIDNRGRMFVLVENIPQSRQRTATAFVVRFSAQGRLESIYDIPLSESVALSRRFVAISPDGDVYFLRTRNNEVDIVGVGSRAVRADSVISSPYVRPTAGFPTKGKGFIAAVRPLTREQVVKTAFAFESVQWQVTQSAYGADPDTSCSGFQRIRRPRYLIGKLGHHVRGVPYCWGCHGSLAQIGTKVGQGTLAGNVCTRDKPRTDVAGVDCSAFVSAAWGLSRHFTTVAIPSITDPLDNAWDLRPGDALNRPGSHVMLFLRFTADRKAEVMEASPGACNGRVCRNVYPLASLLARGYTAVRFRALSNDMTQSVDVGTKDVEASAENPRKAKKKRQSRSRR
jgi:hypothetical protein